MEGRATGADWLISGVVDIDLFHLREICHRVGAVRAVVILAKSARLTSKSGQPVLLEWSTETGQDNRADIQPRVDGIINGHKVVALIL